MNALATPVVIANIHFDANRQNHDTYKIYNDRQIYSLYSQLNLEISSAKNCLTNKK